MSYALWGGRFNPIVVVDDDEAKHLVEGFRADLVVPVGDSEPVKRFGETFSHLISPFFGDIFLDKHNGQGRAQVLDVHNAMMHLINTPRWEIEKKRGFRKYKWASEDPLADILLCLLGLYPQEEVGIDYTRIFLESTEATITPIDPALPLPNDLVEHPTISSLCRFGITRDHTVRGGWDSPGFFIGDASNLRDLVSFWNLRAADISLCFVDHRYPERFSNLIPAWEKVFNDAMSSRSYGFNRGLGVWGRHENSEILRKQFGNIQATHYPISRESWELGKVLPPTMHLAEVSTLGVMGADGEGNPKLSFALNDKPFASDDFFHTQNLVASVSTISGLYGSDEYTFVPLFIPELNEFYSREMCFEYDKLRVGPNSVGLIIEATQTDEFLRALSISHLTEKVFALGGALAKWSAGGLILRQLIAQVGGLQGARVFKIPGVRRLLKTYGLMDCFGKEGALGLIAGKDPNNPHAKFDDHRGLYINRKAIGADPNAVFTYLVEKGLLRMGAELTCTRCRIASWTGLDQLRQRSILCDLCGAEYDATAQLIKSTWQYRRSGVLGRERNSQGAICVALTLQQLQVNLSDIFIKNMYSPSIDLKPQNPKAFPDCEIDFAWFVARGFPQKSAIIIGECKGQGPIKLNEFENDLRNLDQVASSLPHHRFDTFILIAKLTAFTADEIGLAKVLHQKHQRKIILLTDRELEPYNIYDRTRLAHKIDGQARTPEHLANTTAQIYF